MKMTECNEWIKRNGFQLILCKNYEPRVVAEPGGGWGAQPPPETFEPPPSIETIYH